MDKPNPLLSANLPTNISIDVDSINLNNATSNITTNKILGESSAAVASGIPPKKGKKGNSNVALIKGQGSQVAQLQKKHGVNVRY